MKIMVPTAGTEPAKESVKYIVNICKRLKADLLALHIQGPDEKTVDENCLKIFYDEGKKAGVRVWRILWQGGVVNAILLAAEKENPDLVIMGASKDKVVADWLGSNVAKKSKVPVVISPHELREK